jgi:hypothetical protein
MSGVAGAVVGLTTGAQPNIAAAKALVDGGAVSKGCRTNFIGFGKGLTNQVQSNSDGDPIEDFNATDDTVQEANSLAQSFAPTYTADVLSWVDTTP